MTHKTKVIRTTYSVFYEMEKKDRNFEYILFIFFAQQLILGK